MLNGLAKQAYEMAKGKGFHDKESSLGERLMLITSELGEALEADRKGRKANLAEFKDRLQTLVGSMNRSGEYQGRIVQPDDEQEAFVKVFQTYVKDTVEDEIADSFIRLFDLCGKMNIDIDTHIQLKMQYNDTRPRLHGKAY